VAGDRLMPDLFEARLLEAHRRWIGYVQPTGLVVSPAVLVQHTIGADSNVGAEQVRLGDLVSPDTKRVTDIPVFMQTMLGWQPGDITPAPDDLAVPLPELGTTLRPTYVVRDPLPTDGAPPWQMLVGVEPDGRDLDAVDDANRAWAATAQARFDRLLRAAEFPVGLLTNGAEFRLVYAPRGEASGYAAFRIAEMLETGGRPILSAFLMLLQEQRLFGDPDHRLPRLLEDSRRYQTTVSAALAEQVLEGLYELLRGLLAADLRAGSTRLVDQVQRDQDHVYAGLLTVMMRLVFVLYAEDRGLFPDDSVWVQNYALAGLYARLRDDAALHPDTMDDRYGAWAQLLALFRIVHHGATHGSRLKLVARRGRLFDPDRFPFLEGRDSEADPAAPPRVSDGTIWRILQRLILLHGERVSYGALDVEQIGSVYETMMGFTVQLTRGASLAVRAAKRSGAATVINLEALLKAVPAKRGEELTKQADRKFGNTVLAAVRAAGSVADLERALQSVQDKAATPRPVPAETPVLQPTPARRRTGSHYTPRSLTAPIVSTALKPALARLGDDPTPEEILELKVLDPAMGSGAFLVEVCRQLADALVASWSRRGAVPTMPADEDPLIHARRLVAQRCLYGVDHNPMAVDIAHLSLWLATLAKEHEFTFLSHALRSGDSLVGLNVAQIGALHWDEGRQAPLAAGLVRPKIERAEAERARIRAALDWMGEADLRPLMDRADAELKEVRRIGDAVIGAFFSGENQRVRGAAAGELADTYTQQRDIWLEQLAGFATRASRLDPPLRPFHWPAEFPEVFDRKNPGFDAIVGNPPFAGKNTIASSTPECYPDWLKTLHGGAHGNADLVAHFFRRAFDLLRVGGCFGLIATNTIRQGDTRESGLQPILASGGTILSARRRLTWPGAAHVVVSVVHMLKGALHEAPVLDGKPVSRISAFLVDGTEDATPAELRANAGIAFQGSILLGMGFTFDDETNDPAANRLAEKDRLIEKDRRNAERIRPYIGGEEVNDSPTHANHRFAIDFADFPLRRADLGFAWADADERAQTTSVREGVVPLDYPKPVAADWPDLLTVVEERVRPARLAQNREVRARYWWKFAERAPALYRAISELRQVMVAVQTSKHLCVTILPSAMIYDQKLIVFALQGYAAFTVIQSRTHELWARFFGSTMEDRPVYTPDDCLANFPLPRAYEGSLALEMAGRTYYEARAGLMQTANQGLTELYNRFSDPEDHDPAIRHLRELHAAMDRVVLDAYGWTDLHPVAIHEREWEAEEGERPAPWRLRWPEADRDEVLARLLDLNRQRHEEEAADALRPQPPRKRRGRRTTTEHPALLD
jgi:hypothetical protein